MPIYESVEFFNPTDTHFTGYWDGEPYEIKPKSSIHVPKFVANHLAKHLTNRILQERYNGLCKKHEKSTEESVKSCDKCRERNSKLVGLYTTPDREELIKQMLPQLGENGQTKEAAPSPSEPATE